MTQKPIDQMRPLGAQISHMLKDRGVDTIFGIPGVHNQEMYRGIEEAGISHVLAQQCTSQCRFPHIGVGNQA